MLIAQITDAHVGPPGARLFGDYDPADAVSRTVERLNALAPRPDIVLFTGDLTEVGTPEEYAHAARLLARLELPLAIVPGNHDRREPLREALGLGGEGFINPVIDHLPVRLIGLDTLDEAQGSVGLLCRERLDWVAARLDEAPERPTIVFMHHPPFATGLAAMDANACANGEALAAIVARHPQVRRVICGHVHRAVHLDWAGTIGSICPSIAYQVALDLTPDARLRVTYRLPAFQLHRIEPDGRIITHTDTVV